jgi:hypothetical protein
MVLSPSTTVVAEHRKRLVIGAAARTETEDPGDPDEGRPAAAVEAALRVGDLRARRALAADVDRQRGTRCNRDVACCDPPSPPSF